MAQSPDEAARIIHRLAETVGFAHSLSPPIVHRDLKPANVLAQLGKGGLTLKVADFGIGGVASALSGCGGSQTRRSVGLSTTLIRGSYTPLYASPQQIAGGPPDPRDDVYALGVIWFQLLTGDLSCAAPSGMRWAEQLRQRGMPDALIAVLASCVEPSPEHRPSDCMALAARLKEAIDAGLGGPAGPAATTPAGLPPTSRAEVPAVPGSGRTVRPPRPEGDEGPARRGSLYVLGGLVCLAVAVGLMVWLAGPGWSGGRGKPPDRRAGGDGPHPTISPLAPGGALHLPSESTKDPISRYTMDLRVRNFIQVDFDKDTKKYGVEVYTDGHTNDGIYAADTGALAVVGSKAFKFADSKGKEPLWRLGLTLTTRKAGNGDWTKGKMCDIEVYRDTVNGNLLYINENGQISAAPGDSVTDSTEKGKVKAPKWLHAMDLKVRKAGEKDFTKDTKKVGIEVYRDDNNGNLVYISETGSIGVVATKLVGAEKGKGPAWQYGLELSVRKTGEPKFTKDTKKVGIEVFQDENNGSLIYVCETGSIAVVPGKQAKASSGKAKGPELMHAMELAVRKAGEKDFTKETKKVSVEVYKDENNGNVIYISEAGEVAVVAG